MVKGRCKQFFRSCGSRQYVEQSFGYDASYLGIYFTSLSFRMLLPENIKKNINILRKSKAFVNTFLRIS